MRIPAVDAEKGALMLIRPRRSRIIGMAVLAALVASLPFSAN